MSAAKKIKKKIEDCEVPHPAFVELVEDMQERIDDACAGHASRIEWIVGPSRVGKTMLINTLERMSPEQKIEGKRHVPVLVVPIPPNISPILMPVSVVEALKVPIPRRGLTSGAMFNRMLDQLRLAQTRVLIFEEASHLVEPGSKLPPRAAGDWFKAAADALNLTLIMVGVPRLQRLFESNEQLRLRASAKREFRPYDMRDPVQKRAFASCVSTYVDLFKREGWPFEVPLNELVMECYLLSGGLVGVLSRFMQELASQMRGEQPRVITLSDCQSAAESIESAGHPDFPAFSEIDVTAVALHAAHGYVLESNAMSILELKRAKRLK